MVLVEYQYAADGSIASVRLVDAVTGETYVPAGEVRTCPAGVEQPERDMVQLCDVNDDESGTVQTVPFLRDYARDENGQITGHSDYTLDGAPYTPAGTVGVCPDEPACPTACETLPLCDTPLVTAAAPVLVAASQSGARTGTASNGVGWHTSSGTTGGNPDFFPISLFPVTATGPFVLTLDRPAAVSWSARVGINSTATGRIVMPAGSELVDLSPAHAYDPATRTLTPATGAGQASANGESRFEHPGPVTELSFASDGTSGAPAIAQRSVGSFLLTPATVPFLRTTCRDCTGLVLDTTDTLLDGTPYEPVGTVGVCHPPEAEPCASTVSTLRLCDLDPNVEPGDDGKRCAVPFLRHLVHDCTGALVETRDTTMDGATLYTPVEVVDCGSGGVPAMVEVPWEVVDIQPDPDSAAGRGLIFSLSPIDDPDTVGTVRVTTSSGYNPGACPSTPPNYSYANPTTYTFAPDQVLQDAATYVRCDLIDFDTFEPVTGLTPPPSRLGGTAYWDGTTVRPTASNGVGEMYYDGPPVTWSYRVGNTGGGASCSALSFAAVSLRPEGCCSCTGEGSGSSGRTVQEVCVVANAAPTVVMTWTRVIEDDGATIYYLNPQGTRYDNTLPAGHQIVPCPAEETEPCRNSSTILLCDLPTEGGQGAPTATDTDAAPYPWDSDPIRCVNPLPGGGQPLWDGGSVIAPAHSSGAGGCTLTQWLTGLAATLQADRPACDSGTVSLTVSVNALNQGPSASAVNYAGSLRLHRTDTGQRLADSGSILGGTPAGTARTMSATAVDIPAELLEAGQIVVALDVEAWDQTGNTGAAWALSEFTAEYEFQQDGCAQQFLRTVVTDCQTGETLTVVDTTLDGEPYTVEGEPGQCQATGGGSGSECTSCETLTLCDVQPDESPGDPEIAYETIPLAELGPAGSYGDGSPVTGTLPNGVGYSVNVGEWGPGQGHYTFYPADGTQLWTFDQPVYVRFGLRGLNITPTECFVVPDGAIVESISPNHTWNESNRLLCEITGQSSAADESVFFFPEPVTELPIVPSGSSTGGRGPGLIQVGLALDAPVPGSSTTFLRTVCRDCSGAVISRTDTNLEGEPYTPVGEVTVCGGDGDGGITTEPCRDSSSTLLCDTADQEAVTVFDPANRPGSDGWQVVSYTGVDPTHPAEAALPYDAPHPAGSPLMGARSDLSAGAGVSWSGYDTAPHRWVLRKTFTAPEDGIAVVTSAGFRGDGGARVRVNGVDAGMYGQWNQPATSGTAQIPVTAGPNVVEIEVRDSAGPNYVQGRLDIVMTATVQFMRRTVVDCETGETVAVVDTTLDGEPYEVLGLVGQCEPVAECCEQPPPEQRVDVESGVLCIQDADGEIVRQVLVERVYDDQSGDRTEQRLTDPTTGEEVELPAGAELVLCQEPPCPVAFSTECVGAVTRTEAGYDNTSLIGGVPGKCGSVQGPNGQFPCQPTTGGLTITSWIVDGEEVIGEGGGRTFNGGPCGDGTAANPGMHRNWALALTNLDPGGATWSAMSAEGCAWFVGSTGGTGTAYGAMTIADAAGQQWILGPAQACEETQFTKVYTQECDGSISVSWLTPQGVETDAPEGDLVPCGTGCGGGGGVGLDVEVLELCDVQADGSSVQFLRHLTYGSAGQVTVVIDTALDGFAPYTPSGTVGRCQDDHAPGVDVEQLPMCVIDNNSGGSIQRILAEVRYDAETGERTGVNYVDPQTWGPVALPGGTHIGLCPEAEQPEPTPDVEVVQLCDLIDGEPPVPFLRHLVYFAGELTPTVVDSALDGITPYAPAGTVGTCSSSEHVVEQCRCDDTDGDGVGDTDYVELLAVDTATGTLTTIGTYLPDYTGPYAPVAPAECAVEGAEPAAIVQARRVELTAGGTWSAASVPLLQSVTATAHDGPGVITTVDGTSTLHAGESVSWSIARDADSVLSGPLAITAGHDAATVTVAFTTATAT
ncbi:hypothetical protein [Streptomyces sp. NPDC007346]|uniref:hypothetical protein n=1 Tax=Streptomyces sp. NPDC007346 TaxID=3154682 RepID=UPI003451F3A0